MIDAALLTFNQNHKIIESNYSKPNINDEKDEDNEEIEENND